MPQESAEKPHLYLDFANLCLYICVDFIQGTCCIDHNQAKLRKAKSCNKNTSVKAGKCQSDSCYIPESLKPMTANIEKRLEEENAMLYDLKEANNETVETYTRVVSEQGSSNKKDYGIRKRKFKNKKTHRKTKENPQRY